MGASSANDAGMVKIFYNDPQNAGLIPKKFPHGRKYAILWRHRKSVGIQMVSELSQDINPGMCSH